MAKLLGLHSLDGIFAAIKQELANKLEINEITATVGNDETGIPKCDIFRSADSLTLAFKNIIGATGPQGENFQPIEDVSGLVLATTMGQANDKAVTQKAVTDEFVSLQKKFGEWGEELTKNLELKQASMGGTNYDTWVWNTTSSDSNIKKKQRHTVLPVTPGDVLLIKPTSSDLLNGWCAWLSSSYNPSTSYSNNASIPFATGTELINDMPVGSFYMFVVPEGAAYFAMNRVNGSGKATSWEVYRRTSNKNILAEKVATVTEAAKVDATTSSYAYVDYQKGTVISNAGAATSYIKKFPIADASKEYYADLRVFVNAEKMAGGVAYFDDDDNFICAQYIPYSAAIELTMAKLNVPENAAYCYIHGTDGTAASSSVIAQLYVADNVDQAKKMERHYTEVGTLTLLGNGDTLVSAYLHNTKANTLYKVKAQYDSWTMPDPTAATTGFAILDVVSSTDKMQKCVLQNVFGDFEEMTFITSTDSDGVRISIRATAGENIKFTFYEASTEKTVVNQAKTFAIAETTSFLYNVSKVKSAILDNREDGTTAVTNIEIDSAWAVAFPTSYSQTGKPTQVIAMLHGSVGYVSPSCMGYTTEKWINWRNLYLQKGFAVMDVNGWGVSTQSDGKSKHWACPPALETIDKAFDEIKAKYNVSDKLILHGSSMGGATAWAYGLTRPNKVAAMGLFSPATISWLMLVDREISDNYSVAIADWQYADAAAAIADDFNRIVGYDPIIRALRYKDGLLTPVTTWANHDVLQYAQQNNEYTLVGQPLQFPVRIWHGDEDLTVPYSLSKIVTDAYRLGGQNVTLRCCPEKDHAICTGGTEYVKSEAVDFFEMYRL